MYPSSLPHGADNSKAWDLGTGSQLPAIKLCVPAPTTMTNLIDWTTCESYGALLPGQRPVN